MSKPVASVLRALDVLACFDGNERAMSVADVAVAADLSRGTAHRLLHTLVGLGYLVVDGGSFQLTPHVLKLGHGYLRTDPLGSVAQRVLNNLTLATGLHSAVGVRDGDEVIVVAAASAVGPLSVSTTVGSRLPAAVTSLGRVLLTGDADGFQQVEGEFDPQLRSIGVPIVSVDGDLVGALSVVTGQPDFTMRRLVDEMLTPATEAAASILLALNEREANSPEVK